MNFQKQLTIILISLLSMLMLNDAMAQTSVAIGAKLGPSFSSLRGDDATDVDRRTGFTGGAFITISPLEFLSIQPEVIFSQKGATNLNEFLNVEQEIKLNYLDFPVLAKLRIPINNTVYPHIYAGPIFSKTLSSKYEARQLNANVDVETEFDAREFDFGGVFGFGLDIEVDKLFITADLRYGISALKLDDSDSNADLKNTQIMVLVGAGILLGK